MMRNEEVVKWIEFIPETIILECASNEGSLLTSSFKQYLEASLLAQLGVTYVNSSGFRHVELRRKFREGSIQ